MNPTNPLTLQAYTRLVAFLQNVGNTLNGQHTMALHALCDAMTRMAEGTITSRLAFGLPTGTGKTTAIIEWCASVHALGLPYSIAVSSSRIDALVTMKAEMLRAGIPDAMIGVLHESPKKGASNTDAENQDRQILLMSHQMIRASESNLKRYNSYKGQPRHLLVYDESLLTSDVNHFPVSALCAELAKFIRLYRGNEDYTEIGNYMTNVLAILEAEEAGFFQGLSLRMIDMPALDPGVASFYVREWRRHGMISDFLKAANLPLRILQVGTSAVVSYQVTMPDALKNVLILDASFPIRKLEHFDKTIHDAETYLSLKKQGVDFSTIKRFDHVELFRLKSYGGRNSMEKRFKDRQMAKEVVTVVKTLPVTDSILLYVYKQNQMGGCDYSKILKGELDRAGVDLSRIHIDTFGNETSLNSYGHCQHVFLVGILHRDVTELVGQYLGQIRDITGDISKALADDIHLSERAHLAYQALSRGQCRFVDNGQARAMKGYLVEIDPEIEPALSTVMPGVTWTNWKPVFLAETDSLVETWTTTVQDFLTSYNGVKISSKTLKRAVQAEKLTESTWRRVVQASLPPRQASKKDRVRDDGVERVVLEPHHASKKEPVRDDLFRWKLVGQSLVRVSAESFESFGFTAA